MNGAERIMAERARQIEEEGWTPEHDDEHGDGELAIVAACYAMTPSVREMRIWESTLPRHLWPPSWSWSWFKPSQSYDGRIRDLEKAGALCAAEIDRLLRATG